MNSKAYPALFFMFSLLLFGAYFVFSRLSTRPKFTTDLSHPAIIKEIRQLGKLETAEYTLEKVIDSRVTQSGPIQELLFGDRILLIAHGKITAGVDLSNLSEKSVVVSGQKLEMTLPPTELFSSTLDPAQTRVFDRKLGLLTKGDVALETEARKSAEASLRSAACEGGILESARIGAQERITQLYNLVGFTQVIVTVHAGSCSN